MFRDLLVHVDGSEAGRKVGICRRSCAAHGCPAERIARGSAARCAATLQAESIGRGGRQHVIAARLGSARCKTGLRRRGRPAVSRFGLGSRRRATSPIGSALALAMPTWSSWASTNGKVRIWPTRCRSLTPSCRVAVARCLWCPRLPDQPCSNEPRLRGTAVARLSGRCTTPCRCSPCRSRSKS